MSRQPISRGQQRHRIPGSEMYPLTAMIFMCRITHETGARRQAPSTAPYTIKITRLACDWRRVSSPISAELSSAPGAYALLRLESGPASPETVCACVSDMIILGLSNRFQLTEPLKASKPM